MEEGGRGRTVSEHCRGSYSRSPARERTTPHQAAEDSTARTRTVTHTLTRPLLQNFPSVADVETLETLFSVRPVAQLATLTDAGHRPATVIGWEPLREPPPKPRPLPLHPPLPSGSPTCLLATGVCVSCAGSQRVTKHSLQETLEDSALVYTLH